MDNKLEIKLPIECNALLARKSHAHTEAIDISKDKNRLYRFGEVLNYFQVKAYAALFAVIMHMDEFIRFILLLFNRKSDKRGESFVKTSGVRIREATDFNVGGYRLMKKLMLNTKHCREVQLGLLADILRANADTEFGKLHKFSRISTLSEFRTSVPVHSYNDLEPYIERHLNGEVDVLIPNKPFYYATTSGSTGKSKFIPVTESMASNFHQDSARLWSYSLYKNVAKAFRGKFVIIVSPAVEGFAPDGTPYGSISGQYIKNLNINLKKRYVLPYEVYEISDYEARYYSILLLSMADDNVTIVSSTNPSTLALLARKANQHRKLLINDIRNGRLNPEIQVEPGIRKIIDSRLSPNPERADNLQMYLDSDPDGQLKPMHYWPKLEVIACWTGGNSKVFLNKMKHWYGQVKLKDLGFLASEIRGSIPLKTNSSEGVLTIDENFFEFVEVENHNRGILKYLLADELEIGKCYYIYFTNNSGLYRYDINDIVEVKGFINGTPTIDFVQKGKGVTNITGEKLYEQQVLLAIQNAEDKLNVKTLFYQLQARTELSRYDLFCEFEDRTLSESKKITFLEEVDAQLQGLNVEYKTKRKSLRLDPMQLHVLDQNSFEAFKKHQVAQGLKEVQLKTVPLSSDFSLTGSLKIVETVSLT